MVRRSDTASGRSAYVADDLDRRILRLLQIDARRPFSAMADELGVSDQTVARRYQRLRERAAVRIIALSQPNFMTQRQWLLRVRTRGDIDTMAMNLARRSDTAWIHFLAGPEGVELSCMAFSDSQEAATFALLEQLSRIPNVISATAQCCLHMFFGGPDSILTKADPAWRGPQTAPAADVTTRELTETDRRLLTALSIDGRSSLKQLSEDSGLVPETVRLRLQFLERSGALYFDVDFDPALLGLHFTISLWASVEPVHLDAAGRVLSTHREISFAAATTGATNLYAVAHCTDGDALYRYLRDDVALLPGIRHIETAPLLRTAKQAGREPAT